MDWFLIVLSASVIWIASLCKMLRVSYFPTKGQYFNIGDILHKKIVLLVIAHPDDGSMFFTPPINYLTSRGHNIHILYLFTGNANGMGKIRTYELYKACSMLKVITFDTIVMECLAIVITEMCISE